MYFKVNKYTVTCPYRYQILKITNISNLKPTENRNVKSYKQEI